MVDKTIAEVKLKKLLTLRNGLLVELRGLKKTDRQVSAELVQFENQIKKISVNVTNDIAKRILSKRIMNFTTDNEKVIAEKEQIDKDVIKIKNSILSSGEKEALRETFTGRFTHYVTKLEVNIDLQSIKSPFDYKKIYDIGGAAEDSRAILAYHLAIFEHVKLNACEVIPPFIIDTPNQHEQSKINYEKISSSLKGLFSSGGQYILCAMENPALQELKKRCKAYIYS